MLQKTKTTVPFWNTAVRHEFIEPMSTFFDKFFDQHFPEMKQDFGITCSKGNFPRVDIIESDKNVEITAEIAGWDPKNIQLYAENGVLTIAGNTNVGQKPLEHNGRYLCRELKRSSFSRSFALGDKLDINTLRVTADSGLLLITIDKKVADVQAKKVFSING